MPTVPDMQDVSRAVGFYADGSLTGAFQLPAESSAHLKIFRLRNRGWGTASLVNVIVTATRAFHAQFPTGDRVQVGDMAKERGGLISSSHVSHQNGLDADVAYLQNDHIERNPNTNGPNGFGPSFVSGGKLTSNFDVRRNWFLLKEIVSTGRVTRIFVDPQIKRTFCARAAAIDPSASVAIRNETLRRLRPYDNHDDHFHMRIACPKNSPRCVAQEEPPSGTSCNDISTVEEWEHRGPSDEMDGLPVSGS